MRLPASLTFFGTPTSPQPGFVTHQRRLTTPPPVRQQAMTPPTPADQEANWHK